MSKRSESLYALAAQLRKEGGDICSEADGQENCAMILTAFKALKGREFTHTKADADWLVKNNIVEKNGACPNKGLISFANIVKKEADRVAGLDHDVTKPAGSREKDNDHVAEVNERGNAAAEKIAKQFLNVNRRDGNSMNGKNGVNGVLDNAELCAIQKVADAAGVRIDASNGLNATELVRMNRYVTKAQQKDAHQH